MATITLQKNIMTEMNFTELPSTDTTRRKGSRGIPSINKRKECSVLRWWVMTFYPFHEIKMIFKLVYKITALKIETLIKQPRSRRQRSETPVGANLQIVARQIQDFQATLRHE